MMTSDRACPVDAVPVDGKSTHKAKPYRVWIVLCMILVFFIHGINNSVDKTGIRQRFLFPGFQFPEPGKGVVQKETVLKGSIFNQHDDLPFISTGKPDRVSQTLFGHFGGKKGMLDVISSSGRTKWHHRLLLWTLSSEDPEMREHAENP